PQRRHDVADGQLQRVHVAPAFERRGRRVGDDDADGPGGRIADNRDGDAALDLRASRGAAQRTLAFVSGPRNLPQNASQNSAGSVLACLTMIPRGESGSEAFSTLPANFGLATGAIDQTTAATAMATIAVRMIILRISVTFVS